MIATATMLDNTRGATDGSVARRSDDSLYAMSLMDGPKPSVRLLTTARLVMLSRVCVCPDVR